MRRDRAAGRYVSASAYGEGADWLRNVLADPAVEIEVGRRVLSAWARRLECGEGERELRDYARRHPVAFRVLGWVLGQQMQATDAAIAALAERMPVVAFVARDPQPAGLRGPQPRC